MSAASRCALVVACILLCITYAEAGCKKRRATNVLPSERSLNAAPLPQLPLSEMPTNYTWLDIDGVNMLVSSWNQHIPQYCGSCWLHGTLSMIQDRLKIVKKGLGPDVMLARQALLNCAAFHE
jgi:hypothetical protein